MVAVILKTKLLCGGRSLFCIWKLKVKHSCLSLLCSSPPCCQQGACLQCSLLLLLKKFQGRGEQSYLIMQLQSGEDVYPVRFQLLEKP